MTLAFGKFLKQYRMTGSEKADGYSHDVFLGLDNHERVEVFNLLTAELPWSAEWIFLLDLDKAIALVKEEEQKMRGDPGEEVHLLQQQLLKYTGDLLYQVRMIEDYPVYKDRLKSRVVDSVAKTPTNQAKCNFLKQVIRVELNVNAVDRAIRHLLYSIEFPRITEADEQNYHRLVNDLKNDDVKIKEMAIAKIEKYGKTFRFE